MIKERFSLEQVYLILISFFTIDFISTIIALNMFPPGTFIEKNPIAVWFFGMGWIGWLLDYCFMIVIVFGLVCFTFWLRNHSVKLKHKVLIKNPNYYSNILIFMVGLLESFAIINNISLIFKVLF